MIKNIDQNATKIYTDVKTYIEEKSQIDVKHLIKEFPKEKPESSANVTSDDKIELSNTAKNAAQNAAKEVAKEQANAPEAPKPEMPVSTPEKTGTSAENLDTYF